MLFFQTEQRSTNINFTQKQHNKQKQHNNTVQLISTQNHRITNSSQNTNLTVILYNPTPHIKTIIQLIIVIEPHPLPLDRRELEKSIGKTQFSDSKLTLIATLFPLFSFPLL